MFIQWFYAVDSFIFSIAVLLIIFSGSVRFGFGGEKSTVWFQFMLINVLALLFLEIIFETTVLFPFTFSKNFRITCYTIYYLLTPLAAMGGTYYLLELVRKNEALLPQSTYFLTIPAFLNLLLVNINIIYAFYFRITPELVYERGQYFFIAPMISFFYMGFSIIYLLVFRKDIKKYDYWFLMQFGLIPLIAGFIQAIFYGIDITWPSFTLALMLIYLRIQKDQIDTDKLTGLKNRRYIDMWLRKKFKNSGVSSEFTGILFDLDEFKMINDTFGHQAGDKALIEFSSLLLHGFRKDDLIGRYGGDEFLVLIETSEQLEVEQVVARFTESIRLHNETTKNPWKLKFSVGVKVCTSENPCKREAFFNQLDKKMYHNKTSLK